jgi:hypothetical protein
VFSAVIGPALRLLGVAPDEPESPTDPLFQQVAKR